MSSSVLKTLKRSMAAEYSRELSVKVFSGQCRLIELAFRQGGPAGYGLRRQLIDRDRNPKGLLGQRKSLVRNGDSTSKWQFSLSKLVTTS
jgi:DNA invertase Pin-like site-specific DNA recombinase